MAEKTEILNGLYDVREEGRGILSKDSIDKITLAILEIKHGCQQCSGEIREHTEKIGDNGEMVIMCPHAMRILEQHSWIKQGKHDRERVIGE